MEAWIYVLVLRNWPLDRIFKSASSHYDQKCKSLMNDFLVPLRTFIIFGNAFTRPRLQNLFITVLTLSTFRTP